MGGDHGSSGSEAVANVLGTRGAPGFAVGHRRFPGGGLGRAAEGEEGGQDSDVRGLSCGWLLSLAPCSLSRWGSVACSHSGSCSAPLLSISSRPGRETAGQGGRQQARAGESRPGWETAGQGRREQATVGDSRPQQAMVGDSRPRRETAGQGRRQQATAGQGGRQQATAQSSGAPVTQALLGTWAVSQQMEAARRSVCPSVLSPSAFQINKDQRNRIHGRINLAFQTLGNRIWVRHTRSF